MLFGRNRKFGGFDGGSQDIYTILCLALWETWRRQGAILSLACSITEMILDPNGTIRSHENGEKHSSHQSPLHTVRASAGGFSVTVACHCAVRPWRKVARHFRVW